MLQDFSNPHDIAISPDGKALYVSEIGPNKVWKFTIDHQPAYEISYRSKHC